MEDQPDRREPGRGAGVRGAIGATLGAVAAGLLGTFAGGLDTTATALLTIAGTLLGWGLEALFERDKRRAASVVVVVALVGIGAVLYFWVWAKKPAGDQSAQPSQPISGTEVVVPTTDVPAAGTSTTSGVAPTVADIKPDDVPVPVPVPTGLPSGAVTFQWIPDAVRVSHVAPTILAFPRGDVGNGQQVDISFDNLSIGAVEFDMFTPGGSTFMGWSRGAPSYSMSVSYIFNPPDSGSYRLRIRDKETNAAAETSVYLEGGSSGRPYVVGATDSAGSAVSVTATGKGCDTEGSALAIEFTGAGADDSYVLTMPDGQTVNGGLTADSVGHAMSGLVLRSDRCTGTRVDGFRVALLTAGGSVRSSDEFAVPN
ncbi:MAG: hypothetical protein ABIQ18_32955 [Umezawaea sp.]